MRRTNDEFLGMEMKRTADGFVLVELIIFIVVAGIAISSIILPVSTTLINVLIPSRQIIVNELARERMEMILGQYQTYGYVAFVDPCAVGSPPAACTLPASLGGYNISSSITTTSIQGLDGFKQITVSVADPTDKIGTTLVSIVGQT